MRFVVQYKYIYSTVSKPAGTGMDHATYVIYNYYLLAPITNL